jgi:hypothetical protein
MAGASAIAAALTNHATRSKGLYLDGLDVIASPTTLGNSYGVDVSSITVVDEGPGQVSEMTFTIDDPASEITLRAGMLIRFHDHTRDLPIFTGFIASWAASVLGTGRRWEVRAAGLESLLDWIYVPGFTIASGTDPIAAVQMIAAAGLGVGYPLRAVNGGTGLSSYTSPIGFGPSPGGSGIGSACVIPSGTLRQALDSFLAFYAADQPDLGFLGYYIVATVDVFGGLRVYRLQNDTSVATGGNSTLLDYRQPSLSSAGANKPSETSYQIDAFAPAAAYVTGSGFGTGIVGAGSGIVGPTITIGDANSTTAERRQAIGRAALNATTGKLLSGSVSSEGAYNIGTSANQGHAGIYMTLRDDSVGLTNPGVIVLMQTITKTFAASGEETWRIRFGGRTTASGLIRSLTAGQIVA